MTDRRAHPLLYLRRARFLHDVLSAPMFAALASAAAAPFAVAVTPNAVATFHLVIVLVIVLAAAPTIVILSAQRQGADTEDHQQAKYYDFLYEHVSPFRHSSSCG